MMSFLFPYLIQFVVDHVYLDSSLFQVVAFGHLYSWAW